MEEQPRDEEWRELYEAFFVVRELAPWESMYDADMFAVEDPETGTVGYVSVLGGGKQQYGVHVYLGDKGFYRLMNFLEAGGSSRSRHALFEAFAELLALTLSLEDREALRKQDRDLIKRLGYRFRGRGQWPLFRSHRPGYLPWYLTAWEVRFFTVVLQQLVEVLEKYKDNLAALRPTRDFEFVLRAPESLPDGSVRWKEERIRPDLENVREGVMVAGWSSQDVAKYPAGDVVFEVDCFPVENMAVGSRGERPYYAYMGVVADAASGFIVASSLFKPDPSPLQARADAVDLILQAIESSGRRPKKVVVRHDDLHWILEALQNQLGIKVELTKKLPAIERFRRELSRARW